MTLASCIIFYGLGLLSMDMFCDHYSLISSSMTSDQINTCTAYYQNVFYQPWYTSLAIILPIFIGVIVMFRNIKRTIYDILSILLFIAIVALLLFQNLDNLEALVIYYHADDRKKEKDLREIAYVHILIVLLLIILLILQRLAVNKVNKDDAI